METMDPAELEAAMAATGAIIEELTSTGAFVFAGGLMLVVSGLSGPAGAGNRRFEWPHLRLSGQVLSGLGGPT